MKDGLGNPSRPRPDDTLRSIPAKGGSFPWAGSVLGFALGGFFDGILLHQVLQWHHVLSAVELAQARDLRWQVFIDGLFHAAMYVIAAFGLWLLWRARHHLAAPGGGPLLIAYLLIGFGAWHMLDGALFHWALGLHHIRMAAANRWVWDVLFFAAGVLMVIVGLRLAARFKR